MHTKNVYATESAGLSVGAGDTYRSVGAAYGWDEEFVYGKDGHKLINRPKPSAEAIANARLWAAADELADALKEMVRIIEIAGLSNLVNGVQLGRASWHGKASYAIEQAQAALAKAGLA